MDQKCSGANQNMAVNVINGLAMNLQQSAEEDCQPKDLSYKPHKKLKPIPPPLNLGLPNNTLKEFAIIATSPKSPLMQKNLPFRKRAHSFSSAHDTGPSAGPQVEGTCLPALDEERPIPRAPVGLSLSPSQWMGSTSVLLSPAPSSLGSSREELSSLGAAHPWPTPAWHCFQEGTLVKLESPRGSTGGAWRLAEELAHSAPVADWLGPLHIDCVEDVDRCWVKITFSCACLTSAGQALWDGKLTVQCHSQHPFFIKGKGWCSVTPDQVTKKFGVLCSSLEQGDICFPPQKVSIISPDICDKFKRFSFPPEDTVSSPLASVSKPIPPPSVETPLSPPTSPVKKARDPDRPKRPMNAFMLFAKRYRLELIQMHPGKDNRAISVILGEAWRKLPPSDKEVYVSEARCMAQEQKRLHPDCWKRKRSHSTS